MDGWHWMKLMFPLWNVHALSYLHVIYFPWGSHNVYNHQYMCFFKEGPALLGYVFSTLENSLKKKGQSQAALPHFAVSSTIAVIPSASWSALRGTPALTPIELASA
jgi:hypothetical protein